MLRNDHGIRIQQNVNGADHWAVIRLMDTHETWVDGLKIVSGKWRSTARSYTGGAVSFTSDHPDYLIFLWSGGPQGGVLTIGSQMGRASHRADEKEIYTSYMNLYFVQRTANSEFKVGSALGTGVGTLAYNTNPHFDAGDIGWTTYYNW